MNPFQSHGQVWPAAETSLVAKLAPGEDLLQAELAGAGHYCPGEGGLEPGCVDRQGPGRVLPLLVLVGAELLDDLSHHRHDGVLAVLNVAQGAKEAPGEGTCLQQEGMAGGMLSRRKPELARSRKELGRCCHKLGRSRKDLGWSRKKLGRSRKERGRRTLGRSKNGLGRSRMILGKRRNNLGRSMELLRRSRKVLGGSRKVSESSRLVLGRRRLVLGRSWKVLGRSWKML